MARRYKQRLCDMRDGRSPPIGRRAIASVVGVLRLLSNHFARADVVIAHGMLMRLTPNQLPIKKHPVPMAIPMARDHGEINAVTGRA